MKIIYQKIKKKTIGNKDTNYRQLKAEIAALKVHKSCPQGKERDQSHFLAQSPCLHHSHLLPSLWCLKLLKLEVAPVVTCPCCYCQPQPHTPAGIEISNPNAEFLNTREQTVLLEQSKRTERTIWSLAECALPFCCKAHTLCKHFT